MVRFGAFELDLRARELRKDGRSTGLREQSIRILALLLEKPGQVILREEIRKTLWPNDTLVEFDQSINAAMKRLRQALDDSADEPQYIETLARRGYRWLVPVQWEEGNPPGASTPAVASWQATPIAGNLIGKKVSHYRVLGVLGGGGMGVVYKAEDLKLGRRVALKFLPEEMASEPLAHQRFEREARAASALEHPNICPIYEFGEHEGQPFIVMPLLEGQTLRELIGAQPPQPGKPLPTKRLLDFAIQVTHGLEAAHLNGIIHRDIKPANIFITDRGEAKILDFGLAKLVHGETELRTGLLESKSSAPEVGPSSTPLSLTRTGTTVGTASYMSPEQILGETLDARTDLFSFGLVLHEMATGNQAFAGDTAEIVRDAILHRPVQPARELNPELPSKLEQVITKALAKDREVRYQHASEMRSDLEDLKQEFEPTVRLRRRKLVTGIAAFILIAGAVFWLTRGFVSSPPERPELRLTQLTSNSIENAVRTGAISLDGKYLAYTDRGGIEVKRLGTGEIQSLSQTAEFQSNPVDWEIAGWFPDGTKILANSHVAGQDVAEWTSEGSSIGVFPLLGGTPHKLRENATGLSVSPDGSFVAFGANKGVAGDREFWLMEPDGGQARKLYDLFEGSPIENASWSKDGQRILYTLPGESGDAIVSRDLVGGPPLTVLPPSETKRLKEYLWLSDGRLIYILREADPDERTCNFWELKIDVRTGEPMGKPRRVTNWSGFCVASSSITADNKRLAFLEWKPGSSVYVAGLHADGQQATAPSRLTLNEGWSLPMGWTADGDQIIFRSNRNGPFMLFKQSLNQDKAEPISTGTDEVGRGCISPDGAWVIYLALPKEGDLQRPLRIMRVPTAGGSSQLVLTAAVDDGPHCTRSPANLCVFSERSADRKRLLFSALDLDKGRGQKLAELQTDSAADYVWDISPDGERLAVLKKQTNQIQILSLDNKVPRDVSVKGWRSLTSLYWQADGRGIFVSTVDERGSVLLATDLYGNSHVVSEFRGGLGIYGIPSPDGRNIAMRVWILDSNFWMMEGF